MRGRRPRQIDRLGKRVVESGGNEMKRLLAQAAICVAASLATSGLALAAAAPSLQVLSSDPSRVTGGTALVEVDGAEGVRIRAAGRDQTAAFARDPVTGRLRGVVRGLPRGPSRITAAAGRERAELEVVNFPQSGPVFSGPHQTPFICETQAFKLPDGATLGPARDATCWAPTNVQYLYMPSGQNELRPFDPKAPRPQDLSRTTLSTGQEVDFIVRLETGVINRAIYQIGMIAPPTGPQPSLTTRSPGWNGALVYAFGGGCGVAYRQGRGTGGVVNGGEMRNDPLAKGYAVASASLNVLGQNCNEVTSAETAMMVKEHFVESFGPLRFTIGLGGSGGSMQQNALTHNFPGILDGLLPQRSFADTATILVSGADCPLLNNYFTKAGAAWTEDQQESVYGFPAVGHCTKAWFNYLPRWVSPLAAGCDSTAFITAQEGGAVAGTRAGAFNGALYDPVKSPKGTRCGYFDNASNIYGVNPDGSARSYLDNVGVQYGLKAFNDGDISFEQFIDLNRNVGGYDSDANFVGQRMRGDPDAIRIAYATGRVNTGEGMDQVPIIDMRTWTDPNPADVHMSYTSEMARQRWVAAGSKGNFVQLITPSPQAGGNQDPNSWIRRSMRDALASMDQWLEAIGRDTAPGTKAEKVVRNKPAALTEACYLYDAHKIALTRTPGDECSRLYPDGSDPRIVAGDSVSRLVLKCALQPVSASLYQRPLTEAQLQALRAAFPEGVCDYSKPSQHFAPFAGPWLRFTTPGNFEVSAR
jgi:hypothetical protein